MKNNSLLPSPEKASLPRKRKTKLGTSIPFSVIPNALERELELKRATMNRIVVQIYDRNTDQYQKTFRGTLDRWNREQSRAHWFNERRTGIRVAARSPLRLKAESDQYYVIKEITTKSSKLSMFMRISTISQPRMKHPESLIAAVKNNLALTTLRN